LADFDFAGVDGYGAIFGDVQPSGEFGWSCVTPESLGTSGLLGYRFAVEEKHEKKATAE
jgi:hypothetical protein